MNWTLAVKVLQMNARGVASYAAGCFFYSLLVVVLFQRVITQHAAFFRQYVDLFPKSFLRLFNAAGDFTTLGGFVGAEYLSFLWVVIVAAFVITFTSGALAQELEQGTLELLLAYPISRIRVLTSKLAALVAALLIIVAATLLGLWAGALSEKLPVAAASFGAVGVLAMAFALAIAGYGLLFSALAQERGVAAGAAAALTVVFYAINFASQNWEALSGVSRFTIFGYFSPQNAIDFGRVDAQAMMVLLGLALGSTILAALAFRRRDLTA